MDKAVFTWQNTYADVQSHRYGKTIRLYFEEVVCPSRLRTSMLFARLSGEGPAAAIFEMQDMLVVRAEASKAFILSVQSIWERQFRGYLRGVAKELRNNDDLSDQIERENWEALCARFYELRGIELQCFPSFPMLQDLHHFGNACRHGDGKSARELAKKYPKLWPAFDRYPLGAMPDLTAPVLQPVSLMAIPTRLIEDMVEAIEDFWRDIEYIYNESIQSKHPSLTERLIAERVSRPWVPTVG